MTLVSSLPGKFRGEKLVIFPLWCYATIVHMFSSKNELPQIVLQLHPDKNKMPGCQINESLFSSMQEKS